MTRQERAKQFQPFDAMKGLQEALRDREERHSRVARHDISDEQRQKNSYVFAAITKRTKVKISYYCAFHDLVREGTVTEICMAFSYLRLGKEKICFEDIYDIEITEKSSQ